MFEECSPLSPEKVAALAEPLLPPDGRIGLAVSGGPDSMAMAFVLHRLLGASRLVAFIVEHGLRPESADEAAGVAAFLRHTGIETEILFWRHEPVETRIHVQARTARYALLMEACHRHGVGTLCLAHHADDQAETILMRLAKGSGVDGLAGMAPVVEREGVRLVRPFLAVPKSRLLATCREHNLPFVQDPSNEKDRYARGRLRRVQKVLAEEGLTYERLVDVGQRAQEAKEALDFYTNAFLERAVTLTPYGAIEIDRESLVSVPSAVAQRALIACLQAVHPTPYPPERKKLLSLLSWGLELGTAGGGRTLQGCFIGKKDQGNTICLMREVGAITQVESLSKGHPVLWDQRWQVSLLEEVEDGVEIRALGTPPRSLVKGLVPALLKDCPQGRLRATLPAVWCGEKLVTIPSFLPSNQGVAQAVPVKPFWPHKSPVCL